MDDDLNDFARLREETSDARAELEALMIDADRMSRSIEQGLARAVRTGRLGFDELGRTALSIMGQIAQAAVRSGLGAVLKGSGSQGTGLASLGADLIGALGAPGRATGGPVAPGRAYLVGERGPELFVPTSSGQVKPGLGVEGGRDVRVSININGAAADAPRALAKSARQVARAVRGALGEA
jgi:hypothetical protein